MSIQWPEPLAPELAPRWALDPSVTFLNHGSFGACPRPVLEKQAELRTRLEREPVRFFVETLPDLLDAARVSLANFVGAAPENLVFVPNATTGVSAVLRSLTFAPGDQLLTSNHDYNACRNALTFVAERFGAEVVVVEVPFPIDGPEQVEAALLAAVTNRTRLALIDHVTSPTGLIFPVERLVQALEGRGVETLVDGAHAVGMLPLELDALGASYYAGNCHKWLCSPKGAGLLYVRPDRRAKIRPLTISHGASDPRPGRSRFHLEFDWTGTDDPTPYLCVPDCLTALAEMSPSGWPGIREHNHRLAVAARDHLCATLDLPTPAPADMLGALAAIPLPAATGAPAGRPGSADPLQELLWKSDRCEVPVFYWPRSPARLLRLSAQLYNRRAQYEALGRALGSALGRTG